VDFGRDVAVSDGGNHVLLGASIDCSVIAFQKSGSTFQQVQELTSPLGTPDNAFGFGFDEDGGVLVVGAHDESDVESNVGKAYVYRFDGIQTWNLEATLEAQLEKKDRRFGYDVAIDGDSIVVGAPSWASSPMRPGQAFLFRHDGQSWHRVHQLKPGDGISGDDYGIRVALSGDLAWCVADDGVARAYAFDLREQLVLTASPTTVMAGDTLALDTCGGTDGHLVALFAVDIGGTPVFWHLLTSSFLGTTWNLSVFLPDPLGPLDVTFRSLGIGLNGNLVMSNDATVTFQ
jgi:hypothetical protein